MQENECFVCGNNNFTLADGAYVCNECGIQSQTIREEQINFNENILKNHDDLEDRDHEITDGSQLKKVNKLLSWECFNLILIGLTNEIIELGAKPNLKVIVLQLWVRYLQCIEAAFTSKKFKKLPKLNTSINNLDCEILYGVENLKKKILHAKTGMKLRKKKIPSRSKKRKSLTSFNSNESSVMTASQKRYRVARKLCKLENSTRDSNNDSAGLSDDVSLLQRGKTSSKIKIKLTKKVKKSFTSMPSKTKNLTADESSKLIESGQKYWRNLRQIEKKNFLSLKKLISIIRLALMINNDDIYLSDILRWIHEGHFHVNRVNLFLPESVMHGINLFSMAHNSSRSILNLELTMLLKHLDANQLPNIEFKKMVIRFCEELQLPSDFVNFVCKLVLIYPPSTDCTKVLPDVEVKVMAYILFAAKFLFHLDSNSENLSSDFAEKVNQSNIVDKKLFSWNNYVEYIECRNCVLSQYNYLLHKKLYGNKLHNTQLFMNDWNMTKSTLPIIERERLCKNYSDNTECLLKSLPYIGINRSYREIPASTKPLSSTLKWILEYYSAQLSVGAKIILDRDFTQTDILYLTDENRINDLADECDIPTKIICDKPLHYIEQTKKDTDFEDPNLKYTTQTKKCLNRKPVNKDEQNATLNFLNEENINTIFLGNGSNYWLIKISKQFLKRADITKINTIFKNKLPQSFLWFMQQCCIILDCQLSDIYLELMNIENKFSVIEKTNITNQSDCDDLISNLTL